MFERIRNWMSGNEKTTVETHDGFTIDSSWGADWFQKGQGSKLNSSRNGTVDACVRLYSQTIATLPITHEVSDSNGAWGGKKNSILTALLAKPNDYESRAVFMDAVISSLMFTGNAFIYAERENGQYTALHRMNPYGSRAHFVDDDNGRHLIYTVNVGANSPITVANIVSPLNMIHIKINPADHDPLRGRSPIESAAANIAGMNAINAGQAKFFQKGSRPSGVLSTDLPLNKDQITQLREAFKEQSAELESGGIPVTAGGLKFQPITMSSQDAQLIDALRMTKQGIAEAFGVPLGLLDQLKANDSTEKLINQWMTTGLAFKVKVVEEELSNFFGMVAQNERINLDEKVLTRTLFKERIDALGQATLHGVYAPNEARKVEGLPPVPGGDLPYLQQQMIQIGSVNPSVASATGAAAPPASTDDADTADDEATDDKNNELQHEKVSSVDEMKTFLKGSSL